MSASTMLTLRLEHDGFAVVEDVTDLEDIGVIHQAIENCLHRDDVKTRELGERGGAPQIIEIARPCLLAEEISRSLFFRNAKAFSENYFEHEVVYHFDHAIIKPPMNQRETAWHQDSAYSHRLNFAAQRLHWWLPLHDVSVEGLYEVCTGKPQDWAIATCACRRDFRRNHDFTASRRRGCRMPIESR
jgi:phytanoyl-CoA hydroxylase